MNCVKAISFSTLQKFILLVGLTILLPFKQVYAAEIKIDFPEGLSCSSVNSRASIRNGPGTEYTELYRTKTKTHFVFESFKEGWYKIKSYDEESGWIASRDVNSCKSATIRFLDKNLTDLRNELANAGYPFAFDDSINKIVEVYAETVERIDGNKELYGREKYRVGGGPLFTSWSNEVTVDDVLSEYPRPQLERSEWINLNGLWGFEKAGDLVNPPFGRQLSDTILVPFVSESSLSGVMEHVDQVWYRREFKVPSVWKQKRILLHFGAVDWETTVYINGSYVGKHQGGYDSFNYDITDFLISDSIQEVVVGVFDPTDSGEQARGKQTHNPKDIWYTANTGIWQTVWLEPVSVTHIDSLKITPSIDKGGIDLFIKVAGQSTSTFARIRIYSQHKLLLDQQLPINSDKFLTIRNPVYWDTHNPHLYDVEVKLFNNNILVDKVNSYFGLRTISVEDVNGFGRIHLNGKPLFHVGVLDQGYWPDGLYTAPTDDALRYDIEMAKEFGYNLIRKHMKVEPQRWYYWADRLGMLVWQDMPMANNWTDWGKQLYRIELDRMITQLYNHPSIVTWVLFNERWGEFDVQEAVLQIKQTDSSRLVVGATGYADEDKGDIISYHSYKQINFPVVKNTLQARVLGEWGGLGLSSVGHLWSGSGSNSQTPDYVELVNDSGDFVNLYQGHINEIKNMVNVLGLSGAIYSQITDVERESTGLITYDRKKIKIDPALISAIHSVLK
tara:strand:+ start:10351 stop:12537 length:2187 start_codon:yes stop_codon:yes gene_type:complete